MNAAGPGGRPTCWLWRWRHDKPGRHHLRLLRAQGVTARPAFGPPASPPDQGLRCAKIWRWCSTRDPTARRRVFTRNQVKAAPVLWTQQVLTTGRLRAVILNSGNANACRRPPTPPRRAWRGDQSGLGDRDGPSRSSRHRTATGCRWTSCSPASPVVHEMHGGLVGTAMKPPTIMTTDNVPQGCAAPSRQLDMAKGAGMLAPSLATMLCVLTTDAAAEASRTRARRCAAAAARPARLLRQRHRAAAVVRGHGKSPARPISTGRATGLRRFVRPAQADAERRHQTHHRDRDRGRHRERRAGRRPPNRPRPSWVKDRCSGPARLGTGARRQVLSVTLDPDRISACRSTGAAVCAVGAPGAQGGPVERGHPIHRRPRRRRRAGGSNLICPHAYVERNSAYSSPGPHPSAPHISCRCWPRPCPWLLVTAGRRRAATR